MSIATIYGEINRNVLDTLGFIIQKKRKKKQESVWMCLGLYYHLLYD